MRIRLLAVLFLFSTSVACSEDQLTYDVALLGLEYYLGDDYCSHMEPTCIRDLSGSLSVDQVELLTNELASSYSCIHDNSECVKTDEYQMGASYHYHLSSTGADAGMISILELYLDSEKQYYFEISDVINALAGQVLRIIIAIQDDGKPVVISMEVIGSV